MQIIDTVIEDVKIIKPKLFGDDRGFFMETFQENRYRELANIELPFVQDNHSRSKKGVLRGLHFQTVNPQGKLVRCVRGEVFDVVVDIRKDSSSYGQWVGVSLSEDNKKQLWCPPGLAHGFLVTSEIADFEYKCTDYYDPNNEGCLIWNDSEIGIQWPKLNVDIELSMKDKSGIKFREL